MSQLHNFRRNTHTTNCNKFQPPLGFGITNISGTKDNGKGCCKTPFATRKVCSAACIAAEQAQKELFESINSRVSNREYQNERRAVPYTARLQCFYLPPP